MNIAYVHGYRYPIKDDVTLCNFRASELDTQTGLKGMTCPRCWTAWRKLKESRRQGEATPPTPPPAPKPLNPLRAAEARFQESASKIDDEELLQTYTALADAVERGQGSLIATMLDVTTAELSKRGIKPPTAQPNHDGNP